MFFAASIAGSVTSARASAWGQSNNHLLTITRAEYFRADLKAPANEPVKIERHFERIESSTYFEFGLTDATTLGGKVIYGQSWLSDPDFPQTQSGVTEAELYLQQRLFKTDKSVAAVKLSAGIPAQFGSGAREGFASDGVDAELAILYGRNFIEQPIKIFAAAETGYRFRTKEAADQIKSQVTVGAEPGARWLVLCDFFSVVSVQNEKGGGADYDVWKVQPAVVFQATPRFGIEVGVNQEFASRNVSRGRTVFIGLWSRF